MTSGVNRIPQQYEPVLASCEYTPGEPHTFAQLAARGDTVARLEDRRSTRLNEVWRPLGLDHELRALFRADDTCWGAAGMVRTSDFSEREMEFMASVAPALGAATATTEYWREELEEVAKGRFAVMLRAAAAGARGGIFKARVRDAHGGWILLEASELVTGEGFQAAVTISRASGSELSGLLS